MKIYGPYIAPEEYEEAAKNGINKTNLEARIRREGWDHERAITQPIRKQKRHVWSAVAKENGISINLYHSRISDGWDEKRAATEPVHNSAKELGEYVFYIDFEGHILDEKVPKEMIPTRLDSAVNLYTTSRFKD